VTNGELWQFLKLEGTDLLIHPERIPIAELPAILWFVVQCVQEVERQVELVA
jgi:hypothetical protein